MPCWRKGVRMDRVKRKAGIPVSVVMVVRNEVARIRGCLESVRWADEIAVIDQSSTDGTPSICREYTDRIYTVPARGYSEADRAAAIEKASNEWILYIDADEVVTDDLKNEIRGLLSSGPAFASYYILRKNHLLGRWIRGSGWDPNYIMRLFRKGAVDPGSGILHVDIKPLGPSGKLRGAIMHYSYDSIEQYVEKLDRYTTILAEQAYARGKRVKPALFLYDFFLSPVRYYIQKLFVMSGFRDGFRGLLIATFTFFTIFLMNVKIWEMQDRERHDRRAV